MHDILGFYWQPGAGAPDASRSPAAVEETVRRELDLICALDANTVCVSHHALTAQLLEQIRLRNLRVLVDWTVFAGKPVREAHPDSAPVDSEGAPFERDGWYLPACPNHAGVRRGHLEALRRTLGEFGSLIHGVWLDFIRYPVRWERAEPQLRRLCFCPTCLGLFLGRDEEDFSPDDIRPRAASILAGRYDEWVAWKCERIAGFVAEARHVIDAVAPNVRLGMFSLPWRREDFDGAIRAVAGQDLGRLATWIDCFSPMVYHLLCHRPTDWIESVAQDVAQWTGKPVLPIVQSVDQPHPMSPQELKAALAGALALRAEAGGSGAMIFTFAPLFEDQVKAAVVRGVFHAVAGGTR